MEVDVEHRSAGGPERADSHPGAQGVNGPPGCRKRPRGSARGVQAQPSAVEAPPAAPRSQASLANLAPHKTCPRCGKAHGNAKKGACGALLQDGTLCQHVLGLGNNGRAPTAPQQESLQAGHTYRQLHAQFEKLCRKVDRLAQQSGFSAALVLAGATHSRAAATAESTLVEKEAFVQRSKHLDPQVRLVVLKHGSGGAAKLLVDQWDVCEFLAQRVHFNLTGRMPEPVPSVPRRNADTPAPPAAAAPAAQAAAQAARHPTSRSSQPHPAARIDLGRQQYEPQQQQQQQQEQQQVCPPHSVTGTTPMPAPLITAPLQQHQHQQRLLQHPPGPARPAEAPGPAPEVPGPFEQMAASSAPAQPAAAASPGVAASRDTSSSAPAGPSGERNASRQQQQQQQPQPGEASRQGQRQGGAAARSVLHVHPEARPRRHGPVHALPDDDVAGGRFHLQQQQQQPQQHWQAVLLPQAPDPNTLQDRFLAAAAFAAPRPPPLPLQAAAPAPCQEGPAAGRLERLAADERQPGRQQAHQAPPAEHAGLLQRGA